MYVVPTIAVLELTQNFIINREKYHVGLIHLELGDLGSSLLSSPGAFVVRRASGDLNGLEQRSIWMTL
jgi:hypothetical protein